MPPQIHTIPTPLDAAVYTEIFTYIIVVFFLVKLSIDELGPEVRQRGCIPPSSLLHLACILLWPVTVGIFASLLVLGLLHAGLGKACTLLAQGVEACRRGITSCFPSRRQFGDLEMEPFIPCHLEGVVWEDVEAGRGRSQAEMALRNTVAALKKECGLTPEKWGRESHSRSLAPLRYFGRGRALDYAEI